MLQAEVCAKYKSLTRHTARSGQLHEASQLGRVWLATKSAEALPDQTAGSYLAHVVYNALCSTQ